MAWSVRPTSPGFLLTQVAAEPSLLVVKQDSCGLCDSACLKLSVLPVSRPLGSSFKHVSARFAASAVSSGSVCSLGNGLYIWLSSLTGLLEVEGTLSWAYSGPIDSCLEACLCLQVSGIRENRPFLSTLCKSPYLACLLASPLSCHVDRLASPGEVGCTAERGPGEGSLGDGMGSVGGRLLRRQHPLSVARWL